MSSEVRIEGDYCDVRYFNHMTLEDVIDVIDYVSGRPETDAVLRILVDLSDVTTYDLKTDAPAVSAYLSGAVVRSMGAGRSAVVSPRAGLSELAGEFAVHARVAMGWQVKVFGDRESAVECLVAFAKPE